MMVNIPRLQSLLAYLVLHRTAPQARSHLAFLLWPDSSEAQAHSNLRQLFLQTVEELIVLLEQERKYDAAIKAAQRLLHHDPLQEETYRQLMRFYALRGDRAAALRVYHTCVTILERELGAEPSEATRQVYESLLQLDTSSQPRTGSLSLR